MASLENMSSSLLVASFLFFFKFIFIYNYVYVSVCGYMHMSADVHRGQRYEILMTCSKTEPTPSNSPLTHPHMCSYTYTHTHINK